jgi:rhodanese-related sulfurtransferase
MEKFLVFASEQWLLLSALVASIWALAFFEQRRAGTAISTNQLTALVNDDQAVLIDLRDKADFDAGHVVGSINLPFSKWQAQQTGGGDTELSRYKEKPIVLICKMGQQSSHVARKLVSGDYPQVYRLTGGISEWQSTQMPLVKS